jgi:hypothetical protein
MPRVAPVSFLGPLCALLASFSLMLLTGCGMGTAAAPNPVPLSLNGRVNGGQQPVVGAQIQLYAAGSGGNGSAASGLLTTSVTSDSNGMFSITGDYSCPSSTSQVYLVATQGNPGLGSGGNNPALAMMSALGSCGNLSSSQFIVINEVTTVAAAWALAPFETSIANIGASSTNSMGLANAFLDAQLIADTTSGDVATLPSNLTTETGKIYALADAVASCINSDGTTGCQPLFSAATPSGGSAPTNTWDAVLNVVRNPGNNVAAVFNAQGSTPPFATTLTAAPNDWTLSLTVTGGGISQPESLGFDSQGNLWVADFNGGLSVMNPQGTPLNASGFGSGILGEDFGLAIDPSDNVWVTVEESPYHNPTRGSVVQFSGVSSGGTLGTATTFSDPSINYPYAVAADSNGNIFIANYSVIGSATNLVNLVPSTSTFTAINTGGDVGSSVAVAVDQSHGAWITSENGTGSIGHVNSSGTVVFSSECCGPTDAVAIDSAGNAWVADSENSDAAGDDAGGAITEFAPDGTIQQEFITGGGITVPSHIAIDAAQNIWVSSLHTNNSSTQYEALSEISGINSSSPGTVLSPTTGYGLDAGLLVPYSLAVDPSGNIWVSNTGSNSVVMFFGMATPTKTPMPVTPQAP